jgi:hypothetical protein
MHHCDHRFDVAENALQLDTQREFLLENFCGTLPPRQRLVIPAPMVSNKNNCLRRQLFLIHSKHLRVAQGGMR